ncbi:MAG TPA: portal protein [Aliidongia sp.]|uniref:portal protein n=1 Tax=Aliidongia sp. TaxID=1914230 RepID=UPI002DDD7910|nr:portal protein [Aliidongia sp.]HEV2674139.1 portal protein [Aliidongia sp.]
MSAVKQDGFAYYETASATLLAQQPPTASNDETAGANWTDIYSTLESRLGGLRNWRHSWWTHWSQLAEYILPFRYHWLVTANTMRRGQQLNQSIKDGVATWAMQICAAGMVEGLMPSTRKWFKLGIGHPGVSLDDEAKVWLEDTEKRAEMVLAQSNFYNVMAQAAQDLVTFGTAPVIMYEDAEDVIRCYSYCAGEYYLAVGSRFSVDTLYTEVTMTVVQIVEKFGLDSCPVSITKLWETKGGSLETEFVVCMAIEPNFPISSSTNSKIEVVKGGFAYREIYWLRGQQTTRELSRRGFNEKPFAAARWAVVSNNAYGRSPGMDALADTKQLQVETMRKAEGIEKQVRPPMGADVSMKNEPASILPGHITYTNTEAGKKGFYPLFEVKPDLAALSEDLKEIQARIEKYFLVDVFMAISQMEGVQPRNNLEIAERKGEKLQRLGPIIGLWKTEFAGPLIERLLGIMLRRNMLLPRPKSLLNVPLNISYIDMVTIAQQGTQTASIERVLATAGNLSAGAQAAGVPDPLRIFNLDKTMRVYGENLDFPEECMLSDDQVAQLDQAKAAAARQQQVQQASLAAVTGAKTLSQADIGGGQNALGAILGTGATPGGQTIQ